MPENKAPEKVEYNSWKLFEKVIICAKPWKRIIDNKYTSDGTLQGYVVELGNKKQLESAQAWAKTVEYGPYDFKKHEYEWKKEHPGETYEFDNSGFTLELLESADASCQGGKLSFWNCKITKDDKSFVIGIAADLLLDVLKTHTVVNGVVQGSLMFARRKGGVGMLSTDMAAYKEAINDMKTKTMMNKNKTSKHKVGKIYGTLMLANIYAGDFYLWYEPVYTEENRSSWWYSKELKGFKKLKSPKVVKFFPSYDNGKNKLSDYKFNVWSFVDKLPKRVELATEIDIDISKEDLIKNWLQEEVTDKNAEVQKNHGRMTFSYIDKYLGISTNNTEYEFPKEIKDIIKNNRYHIYDENGNIID